MNQIEVIIKIQTKNLMNYMLIGRFDKIEKLKELCEKISDVPPDKQILIYKGKILSNDKLISDYNIDDGDDIILKEKEDLSPVNNSLVLNFDISNLKDIFSNNNISLSNNKEINFAEIANMYKQFPDYCTTLQKIDIDKLDNLFESMGFGKYSDIFGISPQKFNQILNDPESRDIMNNIFKDPSLIEIAFNIPEIKKIIQNNPFIKFGLQNPQLSLAPYIVKMSQNMVTKDEKSEIENSNTQISVPPDPFENS